MFLIPIGVDVDMIRRPFVNWLMIGGMCLLFVWEIMNIEAVEGLCFTTIFDKGLFTHMWLHGGPMHLIGNMLFLWVFGNAVCYKLGNIFYLPTFIALGIISAVTFTIFNADSTPMLGASGAINGIIGMYLIFFTINDITCCFGFILFFRLFYWTFSLSGFWMILLWLAFDIFGVLHGQGMVAYWAHLGGFFGGVTLACILLKTGIVKSNRFERSLLDIIKQRGQAAPATASEAYANYRNEQASDQTQTANVETEHKIAPISLDPTDKPQFIRFDCVCGKSIKTPAKNAGRNGKCPKCAQPITVPSF